MIFIIIIFLLGLVIGSFINALEYRITEKKTMAGRSFCPHCKHQLAWYDLFPLLSFAFLGGNCRYCKKKISWQYPLIELITGITFVGVLLASPFATLYDFTKVALDLPILSQSLALYQENFFLISGIKLFLTLIVFSVLVLVALHDAKTGYILSTYVYVAAAMSFVIIILAFSGGADMTNIISYFFPYLWSAIVPASIFFSLYFFSKGKWMGAGDSELAVLMGLVLGYPLVIVAFYVTFIVGSVWSLIQIYITKKAKMRSAIPLGPFMVLGIFVAYFYGQQMIDLYFKMFLGA
ncbi:MAG: prepilin peptidase [bacterium]